MKKRLENSSRFFILLLAALHFVLSFVSVKVALTKIFSCYLQARLN